MTTTKSHTTGNDELDKKLGGGIPAGSLTLVEGVSDSGKSVLTQQIVWGTLKQGGVARADEYIGDLNQYHNRWWRFDD